MKLGDIKLAACNNLSVGKYLFHHLQVRVNVFESYVDVNLSRFHFFILFTQ